MTDHVVSMRLVDVSACLCPRFLDERLQLIGCNARLVAVDRILRSSKFCQETIRHTLVVDESLICRMLNAYVQRLHRCLSWATIISLRLHWRCANQTDDGDADNDTRGEKH